MSDLTTAARPYAKAVFEFARENQSLDEWSGQVQMLSAIVSDSAMQSYLASPRLTKQDRIDAVLKVGGEELQENAQNFVRVLAENDRLTLMPFIASLYDQYRADADGTIEAEVVSASELDDAQQSKLIESLSKRLERKVTLKCSVDETLISGAIIRADGLVIDGSIKGRIAKLANTLGQ